MFTIVTFNNCYLSNNLRNPSSEPKTRPILCSFTDSVPFMVSLTTSLVPSPCFMFSSSFLHMVLTLGFTFNSSLFVFGSSPFSPIISFLSFLTTLLPSCTFFLPSFVSLISSLYFFCSSLLHILLPPKSFILLTSLLLPLQLCIRNHLEPFYFLLQYLEFLFTCLLFYFFVTLPLLSTSNKLKIVFSVFNFGSL